MCISRFYKRISGGKAPSESADAFVRCCHRKLKIAQTFDYLTNAFRTESSHDLVRQLEICGVHIGNGSYLTVVIQPEKRDYFPIDGKLDSERELQNEIICDMIRSYFLGKSLIYPTEFGGMVVAINYFSTKHNRDVTEIQQLSGAEWRKFQLAVYEQYHIRLQIAVSAVHDGLRGIHESYDESRDLMAYANFAKLDFCQALQETASMPTFLEDINRLLQVVQHTVFRMFHEEYTPAVAEEISGKLLVDTHHSLRLVQNRCHIFFSLLILELQRNGLDLTRSTNNALNFNELLEYRSIDELNQRIDLVLSDIFEQYSPRRRKAGQEFCLMNVINFVHEHLFDSNLCVAGIAAEMNLTQSNLSYHFKHETGKSLSDYIGEKRTDYAMKLLRETDATVEDISNRCGYGSTMSMYRAIRKATGLTPIAYREMAY